MGRRAQAVTAAADAAAIEMDRLRAKYDPLFAAQQTYRSSLAELRQALAVGAISEAADTAELDRRKAAFTEQVRGARAAGSRVAAGSRPKTLAPISTSGRARASAR
ncbi:hypothetical protein E4V01_05370 [Methylorubrum sp. Q1]|uniref:hypothetical protein n=1 Tax=Methylorubrum sp. Q1 TaxID=2562453 RepID=UPI001075EDD1|nr:hypothetical protein [Methylorubrum sp. Q1]TFZ59899.1 hypothetical protein E4V01_05370 [Methylorubrum sp. Q1]